jgi:hypothetical protein
MSWKIKPYLVVNLRESVEIVVRLVISPTNENRGNHNGGNNGNLNTAIYCTYCHKTGHVSRKYECLEKSGITNNAIVICKLQCKLITLTESLKHVVISYCCKLL